MVPGRASVEMTPGYVLSRDRVPRDRVPRDRVPQDRSQRGQRGDMLRGVPETSAVPATTDAMITIELPDGSTRAVARGTTPFDVAMSISPRLAAAVVVARIRPLAGRASEGVAVEDAGAGEAAMYAAEPARRASGWSICASRSMRMWRWRC